MDITFTFTLLGLQCKAALVYLLRRGQEVGWTAFSLAVA